MAAQVLGVGTAVPTHTISLEQAVDLGTTMCCESDEEARRLAVMYRRTGVKNRYTCVPYELGYTWKSGQAHGETTLLTDRGPTTAQRMAIYGQHALPLARQSAEAAIADAGVDSQAITHVVTVSCTGFHSPGIDTQLIQTLQLRPTVERVNVGFMGCHAAINGMRVARAIAVADPQARVLLSATELCTLHFFTGWDPEKLIANALFGDGSAALVVGGDGASSRPQISATGSCLAPDSADAMTWQIGDHGFEMTLDVSVPAVIKSNVRPWLVSWLRQQQLSLSDIEGWCVHPGGPKILSAVEESLGLPADATANSRAVLRAFGNMSSPTVLFILQRFLEAECEGPIVALGFGPGLIAEAALIR